MHTAARPASASLGAGPGSRSISGAVASPRAYRRASEPVCSSSSCHHSAVPPPVARGRSASFCGDSCHNYGGAAPSTSHAAVPPAVARGRSASYCGASDSNSYGEAASLASGYAGGNPHGPARPPSAPPTFRQRRTRLPGGGPTGGPTEGVCSAGSDVHNTGGPETEASAANGRNRDNTEGVCGGNTGGASPSAIRPRGELGAVGANSAVGRNTEGAACSGAIRPRGEPGSSAAMESAALELAWGIAPDLEALLGPRKINTNTRGGFAPTSDTGGGLNTGGGLSREAEWAAAVLEGPWEETGLPAAVIEEEAGAEGGRAAFVFVPIPRVPASGSRSSSPRTSRAAAPTTKGAWRDAATRPSAPAGISRPPAAIPPWERPSYTASPAQEVVPGSVSVNAAGGLQLARPVTQSIQLIKSHARAQEKEKPHPSTTTRGSEPWSEAREKPHPSTTTRGGDSWSEARPWSAAHAPPGTGASSNASFIEQWPLAEPGRARAARVRPVSARV